jgi:SSS family solute:Na+ symporter
MTGLPFVASVVLTGLATITYTFLGGMRAVLWTDFVQLVVYLIGAVAALALLVERLPGGATALWSAAGEAGKLRVFDLRLDWSDPYVLWAGLLGGLFLTLGSHGADQMMVQRYLCARRERDAAKALVASGFVVLAQFALFLVIGVALWAFYAAHPGQVFDRSDRVFARFIVGELPPGLLGLVLGAVFAAAMSTLSSSLNSSATATWNDLVKPLLRRPLAAPTELGVTRGLTVLFGLVQIGVGIAGQWLDAAVVAAVLAIAGFTTGIVLGVFFLALFVPRASERAAVVALATGLAGMTWVQFATTLAWPWFALVGSLGTFAVGLVASRVWPAAAPPTAPASSAP